MNDKSDVADSFNHGFRRWDSNFRYMNLGIFLQKVNKQKIY